MNGGKNFISLIEKRDVETMQGFGGALRINFISIWGEAHGESTFRCSADDRFACCRTALVRR